MRAVGASINTAPVLERVTHFGRSKGKLDRRKIVSVSSEKERERERKRERGRELPRMTLRKRLRRICTFCSCKSPRTSPHSTPRSYFNWFEKDEWTEIAKHLDGQSLVKLAATCRWFYSFIMDDSVWKYACLRDLQVPAPRNVSFNWIKLYASAFDGSHSFMFRDKDKHIDWMRIGAFSFETPQALVMESMKLPLRMEIQEDIEKMIASCGACLLGNIKPGIWIADMQLVGCPVCELETCEGTMQMLEVRHIELFLCKGFQDGSWHYQLIGSYETKESVNAASGAIFDPKHLKDRTSIGIFNLKSWTGEPDDLQPKAIITCNAVAINTNLQENQGLLTKYHAMRAGPDGEIVSIRISQQLL